MEKEIVPLNDKYRVLLRKVFNKQGWCWFAYIQRKFLFQWWTTETINGGWDLVYGYSYEEAKEKAESVKKLYLEEEV